MFRHAAFLVLFGAVVARPSSADVSGEPTVIDGDTLVVTGERIRLQGIDAPELHQTCTAYGQEWACGRTSAEYTCAAATSSASATPATDTTGCWRCAMSAAKI
jgi:endonuclease YncB( thermonuclease family)